MDDTRIYKPDKDPLHVLLRQAIGPEGATLLIPDLQRPFRWSPTQVTRLLDSLLRGWPFGTLLLWATDDQEIADIPAREFWRLVDRVDPDGGTTAGRRDPPVKKGYRMVLDGQQRLQSLIIALTGGDAGFRLYDWEWWESIDPDRSTGRSAKYWSRGVLCLDLEDYAAQRSDPRVLPRHVDYTRALQWVICAATGGKSERKPPQTYEPPLRVRAEHPGKFVQLSRLWDLAPVGDASTGQIMQTIQEELLPEYGVPEARAKELVSPVLDLVLALREVKKTEVSFLELQPIRRGFDTEQYDDAVVNIFTRLNAGGEPLTEEEITFAWIKKNWQPETPESLQATPAFEKLRQDLKDEGLDLSMDRLVQAVSVIWAVLERDGKLLKPSDLLSGRTVGPLASAVSQRWTRLSDSMVATARVLREKGLYHRWHYESLNAFIALASWRFVGVEWAATKKVDVPTKDNVATRLDTLLRTHATRFLILSSWAGKWSRGAVKAFEGYVQELALDRAAARDVALGELTTMLERRLTQWVTDCVPGAVDHVMKLEAGRREDVRYYFVPLWVWHRLQLARRNASEGLNIPNGEKSAIDVDHVVSFKSWSRRLAAGEGQAAWENDVNQLGNCFLLEKNFNVSKSDQPLGEWLKRIDRFVTAEGRKAWAAKMDLSDDLVDSAAPAMEQLRTEILERTTRVKNALASFVRDEVHIAPDAPTVDIQGHWMVTIEEGGKLSEVPMQLRQDGELVTGTYGGDGHIAARLNGDRLYGDWTESEYSGTFDWRFEGDGKTFGGTWGNGNKSHGGGTWRGTRAAASSKP